jgi:hypothetical protein
MRDPDLVHRAERAAIALERAWGRWRTMHGLGSDPLPPVSSYVGYSLEEPWGQPRVVFGVSADEAERLASLLDGHDCVGPIHAEVTGRSEWRRLPVTGPGSPGWPLDEQLSIPAQAPQPGSETFTPPRSRADSAAADAKAGDAKARGTKSGATKAGAPNGGNAKAGAPNAGNARASAPNGGNAKASAPNTGDAKAGNANNSDPADRRTGARDASSSVSEPDSTPATNAPGNASAAGGGAATGSTRPDGGSKPNPATPTEEPDQNGPAASAASRPPKSRKAPSVPLVPVAGSSLAAAGNRPVGDADQPADSAQAGVQAQRAESAGTVQLPALEEPGIVAFRRRPDESLSEPQELVPLPEPLTSGNDFMPNQGPGYRGPRYQGYPPQYQSGSDPARAQSAHAAVPEADIEAAPSAAQSVRGRARQLSRLARNRRQGPGAHEAWGSPDENSAADHAV